MPTITEIDDNSTVNINDIEDLPPLAELLEPGDYPSLELIRVDEGTNDFGTYAYFYVKTSEGEERKIAIQRDATGKRGLAKAITLVSLLKVLAQGDDIADRNAFLAKLKAGSGNGRRFGAKLTLKGKAKIYEFRSAAN